MSDATLLILLVITFLLESSSQSPHYLHSRLTFHCNTDYKFIGGVGQKGFRLYGFEKDGSFVLNVDDPNCDARLYKKEELSFVHRHLYGDECEKLKTNDWILSPITCGTKKCDLQTAIDNCWIDAPYEIDTKHAITVMAQVMITRMTRLRRAHDVEIILHMQHSAWETKRFRYAVDLLYTNVISPQNLTEEYSFTEKDLVRIADMDWNDFPLCLYYEPNFISDDKPHHIFIPSDRRNYRGEYDSWRVRYYSCEKSLLPTDADNFNREVYDVPDICNSEKRKPVISITYAIRNRIVQSGHKIIFEFPDLVWHQKFHQRCAFPFTRGKKCNAANEYCDFTECVCKNGLPLGQCSKPVDRCQNGDNKCSPFSTCVKSEQSYTCKCEPGMTGVYCRDDIDECVAIKDACQNGGKCLNTFKDYECMCTAGYTGKKCEIDIDECASNPCAPHSTCQNLLNAYKCNCPPQLTGVHCEISVDVCAKMQCSKQSTCSVDEKGRAVCICDPRYTGPRCEERIDICKSTLNPCLHGKCSLTDNKYSCTCDAGYTGYNCTEDIDECAAGPCGANGVCVDLINAYKCDCLFPYSGERCQTPPNFCDNVKCQNGGTCKIFNVGGVCKCLNNYVGEYCEQPYDICKIDDICGNGTCVLEPGGYRCLCSIDFTGSNCQTRITACTGVKCKNGGKCDVLNDGDYTCNCRDSTKGKNCEDTGFAGRIVFCPCFLFLCFIFNHVLSYLTVN